MRFGIVVSKFNSLVTKGLLEGAMEAFEAHGVPAENIDVSSGTRHGCSTWSL